MAAFTLFGAWSGVSWVLPVLFLRGAVLIGVTYLVPRRWWPWLLPTGCPVLALWPLALAVLAP
ncbi:hypothetical protein F8S09_01290 [Deinococcus sp. SDU3-2]|uniref:Uncharacterized protein n=1 Tax=Deinococcus terrestris TaxID=2651870 RepID=A0A7X1NTF4_9DEIO|nr:hypothetical protein [Deinococcus terrestris]MPY65330.1 hypothetical protein [Deinococcus terrestris]